MINRYKYIKGFTIIELIIVISIIASLATITISVYSRSNKENNFEKDIITFMDKLDSARQNALLNNTEGFQCPEYFGHKIKIKSSLDGYYSLICCYEDCNCNLGENNCKIRVTGEYSLNKHIKFREKKDVRFKANGNGIEGDKDVKIEIESSSLDKCATIEVKRSGVMNRKTKCE